MMKKLSKVLSFVLALSLLLPVLSLTACTRKLNDVEKKLVGTWKSASGGVYTFADDGTLDANGNSLKFRQDGEGTNPELGHYYVIKVDTLTNWAWFESRPNELYIESTFALSLTR